MTQPVADALVDTLITAGLDLVVGVGGTHTMRLLGALERRAAPRFVGARTEIGAAHIALGYARATGGPAAVLTSTGPGCLNVTAALQDAQWSSLPLLHITTSAAGAGFSGLVHETPAQRSITAAAGKGTVVVQNDDVVAAAQSALRTVHSRPRGAVTLDVPTGTWDQPSAAPPASPARAAARATDVCLDDVIDMLDGAQRPLLFVGGGALTDALGSGAAAVLSLAESLGAPVLTSFQGKGVANWDHPLYVGPWASEALVKELCAKADVVLVLGSKLSALGTDYHRLPLPNTGWVIGPGTRHPRYPQLQHIDTDAADAAQHLAERATAKSPWTGGRIAAIRDAVRTGVRARSSAEPAFLDAMTDSPHAPRLVSADMCKAGFWVMKHLPVAAGGVHAFSSYLTMGTALPMALGLALAREEASLAVVGDGGFQMSLGELATLAELRAPVVVLVLVDGAYGMLRDNSAAAGGSSELGLSLWNPDFRQLARAYGIEAEDISDPADLRHALSRPTTGPRLLLVDAIFSRNW